MVTAVAKRAIVVGPHPEVLGDVAEGTRSRRIALGRSVGDSVRHATIEPMTAGVIVASPLSIISTSSGYGAPPMKPPEPSRLPSTRRQFKRNTQLLECGNNAF